MTETRETADISTAAGVDRLSRRASLQRAGLAAVAGAAGVTFAQAVDPADSPAAVSSVSVIVDLAGAGDYTSLEQAVAQVPADTTIVVTRGTHVVQAGNMRPAPGVRIVGEGYGSHVRLANGVNRSLFVIGSDNVVLQGLRIDGNGPNQALASGNCVYFDAVRGGRLLDCHVHDAAGYNVVAFPGASRIAIANNHVYNARQEGIELQGASHCTIVGNVVSGIVGNGILLWSSTGTCAHNTVVGNVVESSGGFGIQVTDRAHDNTIAGNTSAENGIHGICVNDAGSNLVQGNVSRLNKRSGIQIEQARNCAVTGNLLLENAQNGIYIRTSEGCAVTGNVSRANKWNGIELASGATSPIAGGVCSGNVCVGNGTDTSQSRRHGIMVHDALTGVAITGNRCYDSGSPKTQLYGLGLTGSGPTDVALAGNSLAGNATSGLQVDPALGAIASSPVRRLRATVGSTQIAVPHGLPYTPLTVNVTMLSAGTVWRSAASDATNVYLRADGQNRSADVFVG